MLKKIKILLFSSVAGGAIIIATFSVLSRLIGLLRDRLLTGTFGAGQILDAYYAAFRLPDLVFNTLVLGALSSAFIPVFLSIWHKDKEEAWKVANSILNILLVLIFVFVIILFVAAPTLVNLFVHGFSPETRALTTNLTRIMLFSILFFTISNVAGSILNSFRRFLAFSLSAIMYNLGIIFGIVIFTPRLGPIGLAWGVLLGAVLHFLIQVPALLKVGYRWRPGFNYREPNVKKIGLLMLPRSFGLAISQLNETVTTFIASGLVVGTVSIYNLAFNLISFPINIFGTSLATSVFPVFSQAIINNDHELFVYHFSKTVRRVLYFIIPTTIIFILLRVQIVRLIFGTGRFNWENTILTAQTLGFFSLSLFAQSLIPVFARSFYARHDTRTPVKTAVIGFILNIILCFILGPIMGPAGLALALSISSTINLIMLFIILKERMGGLDQKNIFRSFLKIIIMSLAMAVFIQLFKNIMGGLVNMQTFLGVFLQSLIAGLVGVAIYFILSLLFKCQEVETVKRIFARVFNK
ncbi:MAG: murein biosynthesis integral membrane protein MurJ [Patescibacteria group bacterium]|nr:murein biosynthesis integral membrane protein MurJ [Patescibacteria group bacterium]MDD5121123.1 murein biosynthesis integral membrane protein MurJ [Patescibacteria group bacterium]MDD5222148.1 murein biosynthesis integral membrane protein MurJ [Patescibacteria group bacterium]MDD5395958.1 murein biosynthesis integral membrane protein MurJ [Patescibacteria group bacterium]